MYDQIFSELDRTKSSPVGRAGEKRIGWEGGDAEVYVGVKIDSCTPSWGGCVYDLIFPEFGRVKGSPVDGAGGKDRVELPEWLPP